MSVAETWDLQGDGWLPEPHISIPSSSFPLNDMLHKIIPIISQRGEDLPTCPLASAASPFFFAGCKCSFKVGEDREKKERSHLPRIKKSIVCRSPWKKKLPVHAHFGWSVWFVPCENKKLPNAATLNRMTTLAIRIDQEIVTVGRKAQSRRVRHRGWDCFAALSSFQTPLERRHHIVC